MRTHRIRRMAPVAVLLAAAACADRSPVEVAGRESGPGALTFAYRCDADVRSGAVKCAQPPALPAGVSADILLSSLFVTLNNSNINYDAGTQQYTFDVTLQSLLEQPIGTTDGVNLNPSGIRVVFHEEPVVTSGSGTITVVPDGYETFTGPGQPYYQYNEILENQEVSAPKTWTFQMPPTVTGFTFIVFVSAPVQYQNGYITVTLGSSTLSSGGASTTATAVVKNAYGNALSGGTAGWSSSDNGVVMAGAIGSRTGQVTPFGPGTAEVRAAHTSGGITRRGVAPVTVN